MCAGTCCSGWHATSPPSRLSWIWAVTTSEPKGPTCLSHAYMAFGVLAAWTSVRTVCLLSLLVVTIFWLLLQYLEHLSVYVLCPLACKCYIMSVAMVQAAERASWVGSNFPPPIPLSWEQFPCNRPTILTQSCHFLPLTHSACSFGTFFISHFFDVHDDFQECSFHI
jgi:hypothetical protein